MQIRLNESPFASLLQIAKIVSGPAFPKNLLDPLQGLPPGQTTKETHKTG
jgi:hypothetical protein